MTGIHEHFDCFQMEVQLLVLMFLYTDHEVILL
jgi:hypothetical protein